MNYSTEFVSQFIVFFKNKKRQVFVKYSSVPTISTVIARGVASFARSGGGGAKLKSGAKAENQRWTSPKHLLYLNWIKAKFQWKSGDLKKKKKRSSPKSEGFFMPKSQIQTFFPAKNSNFFLPKKYRGGKEINQGGINKNRGGNAPLPPTGNAPGNSLARRKSSNVAPPRF